jgi:hypothetical protein
MTDGARSALAPKEEGHHPFATPSAASVLDARAAMSLRTHTTPLAPHSADYLREHGRLIWSLDRPSPDGSASLLLS